MIMENNKLDKLKSLIKLLEQYAKENKIPRRSTSDLSPFEIWLMQKLVKK